MKYFYPSATKRGFTLIELSIVLVIIGLIVGGVLTGQDMIRAAEVRAQITQIEKYNSAVNTFRSKFNAIPGDMRPELVNQFGFQQGTSCDGSIQSRRNGDGLLDGYAPPFTLAQGTGEVALFWQDISSAAAGGLIEGQFPNSGGLAVNCNVNTEASLSATGLSEYFPAAKIGHGNFVYVYETSGVNWYGVSNVTALNGPNSLMLSNANISVSQAYKMDAKVDDGLPTSGNVQTTYLNNSTSILQNAPNTTTSGGTSSSCYDTTTGTYSVTYNNGSGGNCAVSFKFQ